MSSLVIDLHGLTFAFGLVSGIDSMLTRSKVIGSLLKSERS